MDHNDILTAFLLDSVSCLLTPVPHHFLVDHSPILVIF
jgi:hypothetical protein